MSCWGTGLQGKHILYTTQCEFNTIRQYRGTPLNSNFVPVAYFFFISTLLDETLFHWNMGLAIYVPVCIVHF